MRKSFKILMILSCWMAAFPLAISMSARAEQFKVYGNVLPPYGIKQEDRLEGFSVDLIKVLLQQTGNQMRDDKVHHVPFARMLHNLGYQQNVIGLHVARSPDREKRFRWVGPYYTISMGLIGKKTTAFDGQDMADFNGSTIGVVRETLPHRLLRDGNIDENNINLSAEPVAALRMLDRGRIDLFAHIFDSSKWLMRQDGIDASRFEEKFSMRTADFYFAFSMAQDKDDIAVFNEALQRLRVNQIYQDLCQDHNLTRC